LFIKNVTSSVLKYISKEQGTGSYATFENLPEKKMFVFTFTVPTPPLRAKKVKEIYVTYQTMLPEFLNSCQDGMSASMCSVIRLKHDISAQQMRYV
jgi:hypothetical protein